MYYSFKESDPFLQDHELITCSVSILLLVNIQAIGTSNLSHTENTACAVETGHGDVAFCRGISYWSKKYPTFSMIGGRTSHKVKYQHIRDIHF